MINAKKLPLWSMITVSYNSESSLKQFWSEKLPKDVQWIVVDNASSDSSAEVAEELGAEVIRLNKNLGFSAANNIGFRHASGEYVGFVNPDVRINYNSLDFLKESIDFTGGVVGPQLRHSDGSLQPNGRGLPTLANKVINRLSRNEMLHERYNIVPSKDGLYYVSWLMGAAVCAKRLTFESLGGWNSNYFVYFEDSELGLRAWQTDVPVLLDTRAHWTHGWARDTVNRNLRPRLLELQGAIRFYLQFPSLLFPNGCGRWSHVESKVGAQQIIGSGVGQE